MIILILNYWHFTLDLLQSHFSHYSTDVTLIYEIAGRPDEPRPITGETVTFTCEVEGGSVTWTSSAISNGVITLIPSVNRIGEPNMDDASGE